MTFLSSALLFPVGPSPEFSSDAPLPLQLRRTSGPFVPLSVATTTAAPVWRHTFVGMTTTSHVSPPIPLLTC